MRVLVYVEGPADRAALSALLASLIAVASRQGDGISFHPMDGKSSLLSRVPRRAALYLAEHPGDWIVALPDLYPMRTYHNTAFAHDSTTTLGDMLSRRFQEEADARGLTPDVRTHFRVHCLKHDLEALLLAAPDRLRQRLGTKDRLKGAWRIPVEDQDDDHPPKRVVEELFRRYRHNRSYVDTTDAPWILEGTSLDGMESACPQAFGPFVKDLRSMVGVESR